MLASLVDEAWDGRRIPEVGRCGHPDGGSPASSPALRVHDLPPGTEALLLAFNDVDWAPMATDGGHGILRVEVPAGAGSADVPPVPELQDTGLPAGVSVAAHNRGRAPIGYRGPCGGGDAAHRYEVVVTALSGDRAVASCTLPLGVLDGQPGWAAPVPPNG